MSRSDTFILHFDFCILNLNFVTQEQNCRYTSSPRPKRCRLAVSSIDPRSGAANALNLPPGKYGRKAKTQRNRRELAQAVEHVVQFDDNRGTSPGFEIPTTISERKFSHKDVGTGAAWPSSVRGLNCSLKWVNERNPCRLLQVSGETAQPTAHEACAEV